MPTLTFESWSCDCRASMAPTMADLMFWGQFRKTPRPKGIMYTSQFPRRMARRKAVVYCPKRTSLAMESIAGVSGLLDTALSLPKGCTQRDALMMHFPCSCTKSVDSPQAIRAAKSPSSDPSMCHLTGTEAFASRACASLESFRLYAGPFSRGSPQTVWGSFATNAP